jgi:hypothetical protein
MVNQVSGTALVGDIVFGINTQGYKDGLFSALSASMNHESSSDTTQSLHFHGHFSHPHNYREHARRATEGSSQSVLADGDLQTRTERSLSSVSMAGPRMR